MNKWVIAVAAAAALAGCKTSPHSGYGHGKVESISYRTGPCFGTCPVYTVTVHSNGSGMFVGQNHTTVTGNQAFTVSPAQFAQYVAHLAPVRPASGTVSYNQIPPCTGMATDMPSVTVTWTETGGQQQQLFYYYGCMHPNSQTMSQRLQQAPSLLPIGAFIQ